MGIQHQAGRGNHTAEGGFPINLTPQELIRANLRLRTASRILVRMDAFSASAFWELRKRAAKAPWHRYITPGRPVGIRVTTRQSALYHKNGIAERIAGAVSDALGRESPMMRGDDDTMQKDGQWVHVRIVKNNVMLSMDATGDHLHRRGYRTHIGRAPLRENLAAALVMLSGWDRSAPLVDPCCGSGTILIEAALLASGTAPGRNRPFACEHWPCMPNALAEVERESAQTIQTAAPPVLQGCDVNPDEIHAARHNAEQAGVASMIGMDAHPASKMSLPEGDGWIVTNLPYGKRVGRNEGSSVLDEIASAVHRSTRSWRMTAMTADRIALKRSDFRIDHVTPLRNGGLKVDVVTGSWMP